MKVTVFLRNEHETVKSLFARYKKGDGRSQNGKRELFEEIRREIFLHSQLESEIFYPALASTPSTTGGDLVTTAQEEHGKIEEILTSMNSSDKNLDRKMNEVIELVTQHIDMEEELLFEEARKSLPEYRLEELGLEMEDRRRIIGLMAA
jgi:iron-sulfur cluster repair protein YtfE (RIC family)